MTRPVLEFSNSHALTAICIFEYVEQCNAVGSYDGKFRWDLFEGAWNARQWAVDNAKTVDAAYEEAASEGYDDSFDWEFVPEFLERAYDENLHLLSNWRSIARDIGREGDAAVQSMVDDVNKRRAEEARIAADCRE